MSLKRQTIFHDIKYRTYWSRIKLLYFAQTWKNIVSPNFSPVLAALQYSQPEAIKPIQVGNLHIGSCALYKS